MGPELTMLVIQLPYDHIHDGLGENMYPFLKLQYSIPLRHKNFHSYSHKQLQLQHQRRI